MTTHSASPLFKPLQIGRFGGKPVDYYRPEIRSKKDLMLRRVEGVS
jgi:hypothetical protein